MDSDNSNTQPLTTFNVDELRVLLAKHDIRLDPSDILDRLLTSDEYYWVLSKESSGWYAIIYLDHHDGGMPMHATFGCLKSRHAVYRTAYAWLKARERYNGTV